MAKYRKKQDWYKDFFVNFYLAYFHRRRQDGMQVKKEVDFVCRVLQLAREARVLDLACGPGRHTLELVQRGYDVTGVDFNKQFLEIAAKESKKRNLRIPKLIQCDMRSLAFKDDFDAVICLYTSFGYFANERENTKVLKNIAKVLRKGGFLLLDLPNKSWTINNVPRKTWHKVKDKHVLEERSFDKNKSVLHNEITVLDPKEKPKSTSTHLRLYGLQTIKKKLISVGFKHLSSFGNYSIKSDFQSLKSARMIILARKK